MTSQKEIILTLTASEENNDSTGQAVVVINWSIKEALQFNEKYYSGTYPKNGKGNIELNNEISFTNAENPENVVIQLKSK